MYFWNFESTELYYSWAIWLNETELKYSYFKFTTVSLLTYFLGANPFAGQWAKFIDTSMKILGMEDDKCF